MTRTAGRSSSRRNIFAALCYWMAATFLMLSGKPSISFRLAPLLPKKAKGRSSNLFTSMPSSSSYSKIPKLLEVEQKFPFSDRSRLEERLRRQGFAPIKEVNMVDWYFDRYSETSSGPLELPLVRRDCWLRYRETITENSNGSDGQWQLKRGDAGGSGGGATVYEEIEGIEAVEIARSVLNDLPSPSSRSTGAEDITVRKFNGHAIPVLPIPGCDLVPFARIVTHRAKWKQQVATENDTTNGSEGINAAFNAFPDLVVDLDTTPDGFAVGEVEAVVEGEEGGTETEDDDNSAIAERNDRAVARARTEIRQFLDILLEDDSISSATNRRPPMGKLEEFLSRNKPRIYQACIDSGVIPARPS